VSVARGQARRFDAAIELHDGSKLAAAYEAGLWSVSWNGKTWQGRSLVALVGDASATAFGPGEAGLGQVLDTLIERIDHEAAVGRDLNSYY
jgi:hypothetical protein